MGFNSGFKGLNTYHCFRTLNNAMSLDTFITFIFGTLGFWYKSDKRNKLYCYFFYIFLFLFHFLGARCWWRSWLGHCSTSHKAEGFIPDGVIGIFHWHNPSGRTMAPGVYSACNRNEYQEYFLGGKGSRCVGLTTLPLSGADCHKIWEPEPPGTLRACPGL